MTSMVDDIALITSLKCHDCHRWLTFQSFGAAAKAQKSPYKDERRAFLFYGAKLLRRRTKVCLSAETAYPRSFWAVKSYWRDCKSNNHIIWLYELYGQVRPAKGFFVRPENSEKFQSIFKVISCAFKTNITKGQGTNVQRKWIFLRRPLSEISAEVQRNVLVVFCT